LALQGAFPATGFSGFPDWQRRWKPALFPGACSGGSESIFAGAASSASGAAARRTGPSIPSRTDHSMTISA